MSELKFRSDINGLRAWAVIAVVFYHFDIPGFSGGFIGVDVFFVISGFLMTGIVLRLLRDSESSGDSSLYLLARFYLSRARRIVPALLALCLVLLVLGWFFLHSSQYEELAKHSVGALGFVSNIMFWQETGYFDNAAHEKLLLHTWSLSVEWQFYLLFPILLLGLWKLFPSQKLLTWAIALLALASLQASILYTPKDASAAFYLLPTRAWQMLAGGLVLLLVDFTELHKRVRVTLELIGFALIIASIIYLTPEHSWPGWRAQAPVLGAVLVLMAARQNSLLTAPLLTQWLGNCSYSLYLWHWPLAALLTYLSLQHSLSAIIGALLLTTLLGWLSYRWIETPTRLWLTKRSTLSAYTSLALPVIFTMALAGVIWQKDGIPNRLNPQVEAIFNEARNKNPREAECFVRRGTPVPECTYGGKKLGAIVTGDSHAAAVVRSMEKALPSNNLHVLDMTLSGCSTILLRQKKPKNESDCQKFVRHVIEKSKNLPLDAPIIIINRLSKTILGHNEHNLIKTREQRSASEIKALQKKIIDTACELSKSRPVYMVRPIPELKLHVPNTMGRALQFGIKREVSISLDEYHERHAAAWAAQDLAAKKCGIKILDPLPYLCQRGYCRGHDQHGLPIYYDDDHLNERGGELLVPLFKQIFAEPATRPD